jgi:hypothetical protein
VVHSKANRSGQAVTHELSEVLSIFIVFVAKNNRLHGRNRKITTETGRKPKRKNRQKKESTGKTKEPAEKTKELAGKSIMIRLYSNKSYRKYLNKWFGTAKWTYNQVVASLHYLGILANMLS